MAEAGVQNGVEEEIETEEELLEAPSTPSWANAEEIDTFDAFVRDFRAGRIDPDQFKRFRLQHGVYGQRQPDVQMVRLKIPWGGLSVSQLERLADIAERTPRGRGHVTTRQNVQFYDVPIADAPELLRALADVGLTTREACGNTVRNVTVGHCAGVCAGEPFDPTPYADAVARFLLRNPMNQNLPRKFKIAFSGCFDDQGLTPIHDIGARAVVRSVGGHPERGFVLLIGGGLGPAPRAAELLEPFTPADELVVTIAAVVRVFDRHGNRDNRNLARLKFVVKKLGIDAVRQLVLREREALRSTMAGQFPRIEPADDTPPAPRRSPRSPLPLDDGAFTRWRETNVAPQRQPGYVTVQIRLPLGDVTAAQLRAIAHVVGTLGDGRVRTTNQQNIVLRWIPADALGDAWALLSEAGLARAGAERLIDVTSCPGADTCQLGITSSRGLATAIATVIERELGALADHSGVRIKISGCPNSCGQHHIAGIGLYGGARKFGGEQAPTYQLLLGGGIEKGRARFGVPVARVPARNVPDAIRTLLEIYRRDALDGERFTAFVERVGAERLGGEVAQWTELPSIADAPDKYLDWGATARFKAETGVGECAA
jgi:sulfite reductase (ferredoxin)